MDAYLCAATICVQASVASCVVLMLMLASLTHACIAICVQASTSFLSPFKITPLHSAGTALHGVTFAHGTTRSQTRSGSRSGLPSGPLVMDETPHTLGPVD